MNKSTWLWDVAVKSNVATTAFFFQPLQRHDSRSQGADFPFIHLGRINARTIPKRKTLQEKITREIFYLLCEDDYVSYQPLLSGWDNPVSKRENKQKHITSYYTSLLPGTYSSARLPTYPGLSERLPKSHTSSFSPFELPDFSSHSSVLDPHGPTQTSHSSL